MPGEAMDSFIWNDIWCSAHTVKVYALCCSKYANNMRKRKRIIDWAIIIIPTIGALLYPLNTYCTLGAAIITAVCGVLEKALPLTTQSESELCKLDNLQTEFEKILTELEDAFHSFRLSDTTDIQLKELLRKKKTSIAELRTEMDRLVHKSPNSNMLNNEAQLYINSKFT